MDPSTPLNNDEVATAEVATAEVATAVNSSPLILLPGLGGDSRLFAAQRAEFPHLIVPSWITPEKQEPLATYAARFAEKIDPGQPCFLGGLSFGGVMALEVATHLLSRECYLIGSVRSPQQIPRRLKIFRAASSLVMIPKWLSPWALTYAGGWMTPQYRGAVRQLMDSDDAFLRWAAGAILDWTPSPGVAKLRIVQIHGDQDRVFPVSSIAADKVIRGAGHLVSLTHAAEVNQFLKERMFMAPDITPQPSTMDPKNWTRK